MITPGRSRTCTCAITLLSACYYERLGCCDASWDQFHAPQLCAFGHRNCALVKQQTGLGTGVSSHTTKALPRPAASGRPFNAHFVDVSHEAGLRESVIYGGTQSKKYIL